MAVYQYVCKAVNIFKWFCLVIIVLFDLRLPVAWCLQQLNEPAGYEMEYYIPARNVDIEPKPDDCDFDRAPRGNKRCHFEKSVIFKRTDIGEVMEVFVTWDRVSD
jgi:hypothetical protein